MFINPDILYTASLLSSCYDWGYSVARRLNSIDLVEKFIDKLKRGTKSNKNTAHMFEEAERGAETALVDIINELYLTPKGKEK